jgi:hypothetical protein
VLDILLHILAFQSTVLPISLRNQERDLA